MTDDTIADTYNQLDTFPREPAHAGHVAVRMKRKIEYKNDVFRASFVKPELLLQSLKHFKEKGHPSYQELNIVSNYEPILEFDPEPEDEEDVTAAKENTEQAKNHEQSGASLNTQVITLRILIRKPISDMNLVGSFDK